MGSVAVDSQTGMEHYNVPKKGTNTASSQDSKAPLHGMTPNFREKADGQSQNLAGVPDEFLHLFEHDASEVIYMQAVRHPVGPIAIYAMGGLAALLVILGYVFILSDNSIFESIGASAANVGAIGGLITLVLLVLIAGISFLAAYVYKKSRLILTNQKVVLIQYNSLISRKVSQLNISEVEDVNVSQPSIFDRIFKSGTITIETAGEQNNYVLSQMEKPYEFARKTIQMHEGAIAEYGN